MKVVLVLLFAILAIAYATKSIDVPVVYTTAARNVVETVPTTVQTASVVPVPQGNPSTQYHAQDSNGQYSYGYVTADGQSKVENKAADGTVSGQFSYFDPEGKKIELSYIADKDGFRASGDHLPSVADVPDGPDVPDALEDAYEEATGRLANARLVTSPQTYRYSVQPASYVTYPAATSARGYQYYTNVGTGSYPGYVQRYTYGTPSVSGVGYQRYSTGFPAYQYSTGTGYPSYQYPTTYGSQAAYQYYTAGRPTGFQYYTSSYAPYTTYPATQGYVAPTRYTTYNTAPTRYTYTGPTRYTYSPTRYSYTPSRYTAGGKSAYTRHAYSF